MINADLFGLDFSDTHAQRELLQFFDELISIHQIDGWGAISSGFLDRIFGEGPRCNQQTLISSADHCAAEVADLTCSNGTFPAFGLEDNVKTQQSTQPQNAVAINPAISGLSGDLDLDESRLA